MPYQGAVYLQNIKPDYGAGIAGLLGNAIAAYDKRRESEEKKRVQTISEIATLAELAGGYDENLQNQMMQAYQPQQSRLDKLLGRQVAPFQMPTETVTTPATTFPGVQSREFNIPGMPDIFSRFGGEQPSPAFTASLGEDIPGFTVPGTTETRPKKFMTRTEMAARTKAAEEATRMRELAAKPYFESLYREPKEFKPELFKTTTGYLPYEQALGQMPYEESIKPEKEIQDFTKFEQLYPEWAGKRGTPEYRKAFSGWQLELPTNKAIIIEREKLKSQVGMIGDEYKEQAYQYLKTTGDLPQEFGRMFRMPGAQVEVMNYIAQRQKEEGLSGVDRAAQKAIYKGQSTEYTTTARQKALALRYEGMLRQNTDALEQMNNNKELNKLRSQYPKANDFMLAIARETGNEDVLAFRTQLGRVAVEWAKITSGSLGIAEVSVTAQENMNKLLSASNNPEQLKALIQTVRLDTGHTVNAFHQRESEQRKSIYESGGKTPSIQEPKFKKTTIKIGNMDIETQLPEDLITQMGGTGQGTGKTVIERRKTADGRILVKYNDGTIGQE